MSAGAYTLSETGGPAGYTAGAWSCTAGTLTGSTDAPAGASATCTINNDDQPARLTLQKIVDANETGSGVVPARLDAAGNAQPDRSRAAGGDRQR